MKKILFLLITTFLITTACKKEEVSQKNSRLKTYVYKNASAEEKYTINYNNFNKIDNVLVEQNGTHVVTKHCIYKSDKSLDSIIIKNAVGTIIRKDNIECSNFKVTDGTNIKFEYNSNGNISKISNIANKNSIIISYINDTVAFNIYGSGPNGPTLSFINFTVSKTIKNPFFISGFHNEFAIVPDLLSYNMGYVTAFFPYAETLAKNHISTIQYTYEGNFNGYPLKRTSSNAYTQTFTYEEF